MAPPPAATAAPRYGNSTRQPTRRRPVAPRTPRRISGPVRSSAGSVAAPQPVGGLAGAAIGLARTLPDLRIIDRLTRGRSWIVVIGVLLLGIVAMQVTMLKLNAGIGEAVQGSTQLTRENAALRSQISQLSSSDRIEKEATKLGLVMPAAGAVKYVRSYGSDAKKAAAMLKSGQAVPGVGAPSALASTDVATDQAVAPAPVVPETTDQPATIEPTDAAPTPVADQTQQQVAPTPAEPATAEQAPVDPAATGGAAVSAPTGQ